MISKSNESWSKLDNAANLLVEAARDLDGISPPEAWQALRLIKDLESNLKKLYKEKSRQHAIFTR